MAAVGSERISAVVGYALIAGDFSTSSPNLPQRIAVICEANTANQGTLDTAEWQATSLKQVGVRYGYGSPAYLVARILLPKIGGIPLVYYPQLSAEGATAKTFTITPIGTATENATHTLVIGGRRGLDGSFYNFTVNTGDTADDITAKMTDAVNAILGCPMSASDDDYVTTLTSKWTGLTSNDLTLSVDTNDNDAGITYTVSAGASGAGTPSISASLALMEPKWNTMLLNSYGTNSDICDAIEEWNGIPDPNNPTGRYQGTIMKPLIALTGSVADDPSSFTDSRADDVSISISPAPLSLGLPMEAAANDIANWAPIAQNTPEIDTINTSYTDMPTPESIGSMADYNERDRIVKLGCSTVDLVTGKYQMKDPVTTFHPEGELVPSFRYRRDLMIDFNIRFAYSILEKTYLVGKVLGADNDDVSASKNVIKPKTWKAILSTQFFPNLVSRGLIADLAFSVDSLVIGIDANNPQRFNTTFNYKRTGVARISATEATAGFNFGTITL